MRDLAFIAFLLVLFGMGFKRPFLLVLAYVYIDIVSPQRLTYLLLNAIPISLVAWALAVGGWIAADDKKDVRIAPRQWLILLLMAYCWATTQVAQFPLEAAGKWEWVWKSLIFAVFLPFTLRTRLRIESLLLFMILSAGTIIIVGGIKTIATHGGGYGELDLMVNNNSGIYEGSTISTVAVAIIPIIIWFTRWGTVFPPDWRVKAFGLALIFACMLIPVGTSTRTGLVCIGLLAVTEFRTVKRKARYVAILCLLAVASVPMLPSAFTDRMSTIKTYKSDESASTRIAVWNWTMDFARQHPFGGGFEAFRGDKLRYVLTEADGRQRIATDQARAYHSAYFEMLGEQGYPGLALWLLINLIGLVRMEVLRRRWRDEAGPHGWAGPLAGALQSAHIVYLLGAGFVGIAFQSFIYMLIGAQIGLDTYLRRQPVPGDTARAFRAPRRPAWPGRRRAALADG